MRILWKRIATAFDVLTLVALTLVACVALAYLFPLWLSWPLSLVLGLRIGGVAVAVLESRGVVG